MTAICPVAKAIAIVRGGVGEKDGVNDEEGEHVEGTV
jgi:hypothetical protein